MSLFHVLQFQFIRFKILIPTQLTYHFLKSQESHSSPHIYIFFKEKKNLCIILPKQHVFYTSFPEKKKNVERAGRKIIWFIKGVVLTDEAGRVFLCHRSQCTTGKLLYLIFRNFVAVLTKFAFREEDWTLDYDSMLLCYFFDITWM